MGIVIQRKMPEECKGEECTCIAEELEELRTRREEMTFAHFLTFQIGVLWGATLVWVYGTRSRKD